MTSALQSDLASRPVDESISELEMRSRDASATANRSHAVGPFGVLDFTGTQQPAGIPSSGRGLDSGVQPYLLRNRGPEAPDDEITSIVTPEQSVESNIVAVEGPDTTSPHTDLSLESLNNIDDFLDWPDLFELDFASPDFPSSGISYALPKGSLQMEATYRFDQVTYPQQVCSNQQRDQQSRDLQLMTNTSAPEASLGEIIPADAQTLLKHFNDQVIAQLSSLPPSEKPHWTILNVQSAVLTLANITYIQTSCTSNAAMANLMALLAMSGRHLAHQNASQHTETASYWLNISDSAIQQAKQHLQHSLKNEISGPYRAKYKDQVMAISALLAFAVRTFLAVSLGHADEC